MISHCISVLSRLFSELVIVDLGEIGHWLSWMGSGVVKIQMLTKTPKPSSQATWSLQQGILTHSSFSQGGLKVSIMVVERQVSLFLN